MAALDAVFKAYDVRGTVPDQLDARTCRAIGWAFARFADAAPHAGGPRHAGDGAELSLGVRLGGPRPPARTVVDLGLGLDRPALLRLRQPRRARGDVHRVAQPGAYNGLKLCLSGARPVGPGHRAGRDPGGRRGGARRSGAGPGRPEVGGIEQRDVLDAYARARPLLRRHLGAAPAAGGGRHGQRDGRARRPAGVRAGFPSSSRSSSPSSTAPSPTTPPTPSSRRTSPTLQDGGARAAAPTSDWRSTATPTASSWWTSAPSRCRVRSPPRSSPRRCSTKYPGSTVLYNCICSKVVPEMIAENGGVAVRTRVGHSFIKQVMAETGAVFGGEHSGHYYFRDNYRADSGLIAALVVLELMSTAGEPLSRAARPVPSLRRLRRDQHRGGRPAGGRRGAGRGLRRRGAPDGRPHSTA